MEKMTKRYFFILFLILFIAAFLRFYNLGSIPAGLHGDAASQGYNAFSLLQTGKDRYGQPRPILFRSLGSYQPPIYTYLTTIPVSYFGNTAFSARFISAVSGILLSLITFLFLRTLFPGKPVLALLGAGVVAVAPWSVFFSRLAVEANLALLIFASSMLLFWNALKKPYLFVAASFLLGISTHAYYSERLVAIIFLPIFLLLFKNWMNQKRWLLLGLLAFILTQTPHFSIISTGAYIRRFDQVSNSGSSSLMQTFFDNYIVYFSPANLFFDSALNLGRMLPGLSVFYTWMILPFILGLRELLSKRVEGDVKKLLFLLFILTPIPAGLTGDLFYPLRVLDFLWVLTVIIAIGTYSLITFFKANIARVGAVAALALYSIFSLHVSYFILFKYERAESYGYAYVKLTELLPRYQDKEIIIDSARDLGIGVRMAYLTRFDSHSIQEQLRPQMKTPYYNSSVNTNEVYRLGNITVKPVRWGEGCQENVIYIGDPIALSEKEIKEHKLKFEFEIKDLSGKTALLGYKTQPEEKCPSL